MSALDTLPPPQAPRHERRRRERSLHVEAPFEREQALRRELAQALSSARRAVIGFVLSVVTGVVAVAAAVAASQ